MALLNTKLLLLGGGELHTYINSNTQIWRLNPPPQIMPHNSVIIVIAAASMQSWTILLWDW